MNKQLFLLFLFGICTLGLACDDDTSQRELITITDNFTTDAAGWDPGFSDYFADQDEENLDLDFTYTTLPAPLDTTEGALRLAGTNTSDDLFMFLTKEITGLEPNQPYSVTIDVVYASDVPDNTVGIGGSPGESVYVKAGAAAMEPLPFVTSDGIYRMNVDKGNQSQGGSNARVIGDFANGTDQERYTLLTESLDRPITVTADDNGSIWLLVGTDSGFEGRTTIYYDRIAATIERR